MTMHHGCALQCTCMSTCNADQTRPDPTRPDPFLSLTSARHHIAFTASTTEGGPQVVEKRNVTETGMGSATNCELAAKTETNKTEPEERVA